MGVRTIHSFLVPPGRGEETQPHLAGTRIAHRGRLFEMLESLFEEAEDDCPIETVFVPDPDGRQANERRNLFLGYLGDPTISNARAIAGALCEVTTHRSGLGLLFLIVGDDGDKLRLVLARFPADQGVVAQEDRETLHVDFLERVFMKSAYAYKSATFVTRSLSAGFWDGRAVDKQIDGQRELSQYWITEFLSSEFRTTGPAGTRRLANAIRNAIASTTDVPVRGELVAFAQLVPGHAGRSVTPTQMVEQMGLSEPARTALVNSFTRSDIADEPFQLDLSEFRQQLPQRVVGLDNGALLMGAIERFEDTFSRQPLADGRVRFTTEGTIVDEHLGKRRP